MKLRQIMTGIRLSSLFFTVIFFFPLFLLSLTGCDGGGKSYITLSMTGQSINGSRAPGGITGLTVTVTAPDMAAVEQTFSADTTSIILEVPAGDDRIVEVVASFDRTGDGVLLAGRGSATVNCPAGVEVPVTITMYPDETKVLIPDRLNYRLVQVDSLTTGTAAVSSSWRELVGTSAGFLSDTDFRPSDTDIDCQGRIYIANAYGSSGMGNNKVVRVDNITGANPFSFAEASYDYAVTAITVDRVTSFVYYGTESFNATERLFRSTFDNSTYTNLDVTTGVEAIAGVRGLSVDANGILYITGTNDTGDARVFRYDPATESVTHSYSANLVSSYAPMDVMARNGYVYVTNPEGTDGFRLLQLDTDLRSLLDSYGGTSGSLAIDLVTEGNLIGPERFLATLNEGFTLVDEDYGGGSADRLVYVHDFEGTGWLTYGENGDAAVGYFRFDSNGI